jgi:mannose-6-phosphate isomerase-like protein (cupin superfamily)
MVHNFDLEIYLNLKFNKIMKRKEFLANTLLAGLILPNVNAFANTVDGKQLKPFYLPPLPPLEAGPGGLDIRTWVRSTQTNNQFSCVEAAVAPKTMGPPPHIHKELDEICFVLEGTASVLVGEEVYEVKAGGFHLRPRGIVHTFWNAGNEKLRFMDLYFNQNFEDYLEELFHSIYVDMAKNKMTPMDAPIAKRMDDLNAKFGCTMFPEKRQAIMDKYGLK